jgi:hypothetical protein
VLTDVEREVVKANAKHLLQHIQDRLSSTGAAGPPPPPPCASHPETPLDAELPADPYPPGLFDEKVQAIYDHIATTYGATE